MPLRALAFALALLCATAIQALADEETSMQGSNGDPAVAKIDAFIAREKVDKSAANWKQKLPKPPKVEFTNGKTYYWNLVTSQGPIRIKLLPATAPMHVASTIYLTELGFYDGTPFHRVITGFMAQGGDPTGSGSGGPGYTYSGEFDPKLRHDRGGLLSMANAGPGTDGSQFFLTFVPTPWLDGKHTIFGEVVDGNQTLEKLEQRGSQSGRTSESLTLERATITVE